MKTTLWMVIGSVMGLAACGGATPDVTTTDEGCAEGQTRCDQAMLQQCVGSAWADWTDCAASGQGCALSKGVAACSGASAGTTEGSDAGTESGHDTVVDPIGTDPIDTGADTGPAWTDTGAADTGTDSGSMCTAPQMGITFVPARVMFLVDFADSMSMGFFGHTRWEALRTEIANTIKKPANAAIEFGFDGFPVDAQTGGGTCKVSSSVFLDAAPGMQATIIQAMQGLTPSGSTPLCKALLNYDPDLHPDYAPMFMAEGAQRYLVVIAGGVDSCGDANNPSLCGTTTAEGTASTVSTKMMGGRAEALFKHGVYTYVAGFNTGFNPSDAISIQLQATALAGGVGGYAMIRDISSLQTSIDGIGKFVASCTYTLTMPAAPADPNVVNLKMDGKVSPQMSKCDVDTNKDGWHWLEKSDATWRVELCGGACTQIKNSETHIVKATYGCHTAS